MAFPIPHLLLLPIELLFELSDHLPLDSILALKLTHRLLNDNLPTLPRLRNRTLDRCARFAIERLHISPNEAPAQQRCILCKIVYPQAMFTSSSSPACLPIRFEEGAPRTEVVQLPKGFCSWHVGRLARVIRTEPGGRNEWVSDVKRMCMHNGCVEGWHECTCACSSCGYKMVRTYTRFLNNKLECKKFYFWRNTAAAASEDPDEQAAGRLYVQEVCWNPSATPGKTIIQLPVRYEDVTKTGDEMLGDRTDTGQPRRRKPSSLSIEYDKYSTTGEFLCSIPF